jgi:bacteriocin-like protein
MNATDTKTTESCESIRTLSNEELDQVTGGIIIVGGMPALTDYRLSYWTPALTHTAAKFGG